MFRITATQSICKNRINRLKLKLCDSFYDAIFNETMKICRKPKWKPTAGTILSFIDIVVIISLNINHSSNWMRSNLILNFDSSQSNPFGKINLHFKRIRSWENENEETMNWKWRNKRGKNDYSNETKSLWCLQKPLLLWHRIFRLRCCRWCNWKRYCLCRQRRH